MPPLRDQPTWVLREMLESICKYDEENKNLKIYKEIDGIIKSRERRKKFTFLVDELMFV